VIRSKREKPLSGTQPRSGAPPGCLAPNLAIFLAAGSSSDYAGKTETADLCPDGSPPISDFRVTLEGSLSWSLAEPTHSGALGEVDLPSDESVLLDLVVSPTDEEIRLPCVEP